MKSARPDHRLSARRTGADRDDAVGEAHLERLACAHRASSEHEVERAAESHHSRQTHGAHVN